LDNADFSEMKHLPRFAISDDADLAIGAMVRVTGRELRHIRDVMRLGPGAELALCSTNGNDYSGRIVGFEPRAAMITVVGQKQNQEPNSPRLILAAGIIKAARMDLVIEKAAELDASEFWPLKCTRSVVREPSSGRLERWRRISLAATKQSLRSPTMQIRDPLDVSAMVAGVPKSALAVTCVSGAEPLNAIIRRKVDGLKASPPAVVLAIGPEGDFTAEELVAMREAGFVAAGLGGYRLRSETAALAALSITTGFFAALENSESTAQAGRGLKGPS
jgi:16S rRNA (uracil1498-N3)-methyltransferase